MGGPRGTVEERFRRRITDVAPTERGCVEWPGARSDGYGVLNDHGVIVYAHRLAFLLGGGVLAEGECVLHHCDNPPCTTFEHLFAGTKAINNADMAAKGRARNRPSRGSGHYLASTTERVIAEGKRRCAAGEGVSSVARDLGITRSVLKSAVADRSWKHVA